MRGLPIVLLFPLCALAAEPDAIEEALAAVRPRATEERWRLVTWRTSLSAALEEAGKIDRPVFFFGYDGILGSGNC